MRSEKIKTIFMPIFHGHISRNVFLTDIFKILSGRKDIRLVIFTYNFKRDYYQKEFARPNVIIEGIDDKAIPLAFLEGVFKFLFACFVNSPKPVQVFKETLAEDKNYPVYFAKRLMTAVLGSCSFLRDIVRFAYFLLVPSKKVFVNFFNRYKPDAVFLPDMTFLVDSYLLRIAKERGLSSIAMLRSWDVLTSNKGTIRIKPDQLIVHNGFMKEMAIKLGDMKTDDVLVAGMPQFDFYFNHRPSSRKEFFEEMGLNPDKKVILFALTGPWSASIDRDIIDIVSRAIDSNEVPKDVQLLIRMHPNSNKEEFKAGGNIVFHRPEGVYFPQGRLSDMEFNEEWLQNLLDSIFYSSVTINAQSTMTVDAAAFDKPIINLAFDGYKKLPYYKSVRRLYDFEHYAPIVKTGGVRLAYSQEELIYWINRYLEDPSIDKEERKRIKEEQCFKFDGKSSERTADHILDFLGLI